MKSRREDGEDENGGCYRGKGENGKEDEGGREEGRCKWRSKEEERMKEDATSELRQTCREGVQGN